MGTQLLIGIAYFDATDGTLQYAQYSSYTGAWSFTRVQAGSTGIAAGLFPSVRFSPSGEPRIAFYQSNFSGANSLRFASYSSDQAPGPLAVSCTDINWTCYTADSGEGVGQYPSLALNEIGEQRIAYYDGYHHSLKVARYLGAAGNCGESSTWQCDTIETIASVNALQGNMRKVSLQAGAGEKLTLAYFNANSNSLKVATFPHDSGGNCGPTGLWLCEAIDSPIVGIGGSNAGVGVSMRLDSSGQPLIAYQITGSVSKLKFAGPASRLGLATGNCGLVEPFIYQCDVVDDGLRGASHNIGGSSLALGMDGLALVAYQDATDGDLLLAREETVKPPPTCGGSYTPNADASLYSDQPAQNTGSNVQLQIVNTASYTHTALLSFDLGATIPPSATITNAALELSLSQAPSPVPYRLQARAVRGSWSKGAVTWNNHPELGAQFPPQYYSQDTSASLRVEVRDLVNLWATGTITQTSILLQPLAGDLTDVRFASRESLVKFTTPRLVVESAPYSPPPPYDATAGDLRQMAGFARLEAASVTTPTFRLERGAVRFATLDVPVPLQVGSDGLARAQWFTRVYSDVLRLSDPTVELQLVRRTPDDQDIFFRQRHNGIPVFPAELGVHLYNGHVTMLGGGYQPDITLSPTPKLAARQAETLALALFGAASDTRVRGDTQLRYLNLGLIGNPDRNTYLTWEVPMPNGDSYFIDANSGALRFVNTRTKPWTLALRSRYNLGPSNYCDNADFSLCTDQGCEGTVPREVADAWWNARDVWFYWEEKLNRIGYTGDDPTFDMYIHVGNPWHNAHWVGGCDYFEFGGGWPISRDVVGHEYTHAVIDYTSKLIYQDEIWRDQREHGRYFRRFC